eukprot:UN00557
MSDTIDNEIVHKSYWETSEEERLLILDKMKVRIKDILDQNNPRDDYLNEKCKDLRFLFSPCSWSDLCEGDGHHRWSFTCALAEARLFGRIMIYTKGACLKCRHVPVTCKRENIGDGFKGRYVDINT